MLAATGDFGSRNEFRSESAHAVDYFSAVHRRVYREASSVAKILSYVAEAVWNYEASGKRVLTQWFSYRKKNRERPIIGDRRPPSKLGVIQANYWLAEYTTELINVLHVLTMLTELEAGQAQLLEEICEGSTLAFRR